MCIRIASWEWWNPTFQGSSTWLDQSLETEFKNLYFSGKQKTHPVNTESQGLMSWLLLIANLHSAQTRAEGRLLAAILRFSKGEEKWACLPSSPLVLPYPCPVSGSRTHCHLLPCGWTAFTKNPPIWRISASQITCKFSSPTTKSFIHTAVRKAFGWIIHRAKMTNRIDSLLEKEELVISPMSHRLLELRDIQGKTVSEFIGSSLNQYFLLASSTGTKFS